MSATGLVLGLPLGFALAGFFRLNISGVPIGDPFVLVTAVIVSTAASVIASARAAWTAATTNAVELMR